MQNIHHQSVRGERGHFAGKRAPCPQCDRGQRDKALSITTDDRGVVSFCHRCGYTSADNHIKQPAPRITTQAAPLDWSNQAAYIWRRTQGLRGTLGEVYLQHRGCALPPSDSHLRYSPIDGKYPPSLCACITDAVTGKPISLHFTRLASDGRGKAGSDCDKQLLRGHRKKGGVIRLWLDADVTNGVAIAEGIETALAAAHLFSPVWAAVDAGNLAALPALPGIESITIFADHDDAGLRAARECGRRWRDAGREVRITTPATQGHDIADEVTHGY
jgi:phage/plasmid primase-like uncharacterized protein